MVVVRVFVVVRVRSAVETFLLGDIAFALSLKNEWDDEIYKSDQICRYHASCNIDKPVRLVELEREVRLDR